MSVNCLFVLSTDMHPVKNFTPTNYVMVVKFYGVNGTVINLR